MIVLLYESNLLFITMQEQLISLPDESLRKSLSILNKNHDKLPQDMQLLF